MKTKIFILILLCVVTSAANADIVSVNWNRWGEAVTDVYDGYGVEPANNWYNIIEYDNERQRTDMTTSSGGTSTIDFDLTGGEFNRLEWETNESDPSATYYTPMASGFVYYDVGTLTISDINGTFPNLYDVILYANGWAGDISFSDGATTYYIETADTPDLIRSTDTDDSDGIDQGTYVRFNGLTADSVTINILGAGNGLCGFQVVGPDKGAAYGLSPDEVVNKDFDPAELSWISGDVPDDPSLTVNSFDLQYYTKASAAVTADDPNWIANPGTTVTGVTSPHAMAFAYDTVYFWRIHSNVTWTTAGSETIPSQDATVVVEPSQVPPKVDIEPDGARTWPGEPISLPTTVKELDAFSYEWTVVGAAGTNWPAANPPGDPNLFLTGTTLVDQGGGVWTATPVFTPTGTDPNILGQYEIKLVATDGVPSDGSDTMWVTVHETPCETFDASDGYIWPFDDNFDCEINLEDYAAWAAVWLEDRNPTGAIIYFP